MARYLVLEIANNEEAEALVSDFNKATRSGSTKNRVVGLFAPPRIFACRCGAVDAKYRKTKAERGAKYGWWLCGDCNKPRAGGHNLNNLIPMAEVIGKGPTGMGPYREDLTNGFHYEWKISQLMIHEVPLDNIGRKKKFRIKKK